MIRLMICACVLALLAVPVCALAQDGHEGHDHDVDHTDSIPEVDFPDRPDRDNQDDHATYDERRVVLTPEVLAEFGVELSEAGPGLIRNEIIVPGEIALNGDRLAHIVPRFTGVIREVRKNIGDHVRFGRFECYIPQAVV